jgi:hypothetical protein
MAWLRNQPRPIQIASRDLLSRDPAAAPQKVQDQGDHRDYQKDVDQTASHMEDAQSQQPRHQQDHKQDREDTHRLPPRKGYAGSTGPRMEESRYTRRKIAAVQEPAHGRCREASDGPVDSWA